MNKLTIRKKGVVLSVQCEKCGKESKLALSRNLLKKMLRESKK